MACQQAHEKESESLGGEGRTPRRCEEGQETETALMIETDTLYAHIKTDDWLKPTAEKLLRRMARGEFGVVFTSREVLHELYYVSMEEGVSLEGFISRLASLTGLPNLKYLDTTTEIDMLAATLMKQFKLNSIFDAYYAATALNAVTDHTIASTDEVFDKVTGITRVDPRSI